MVNLSCRSVALHCVGVEGDDILDEEDCLPQLALGVENSHCLVALGDHVVLVKLAEELVELVGAIVLNSSSLELRREVLRLAHEYVSYVCQRHDLCLGGHVEPQVLEFHGIVVVDRELQRLARLGVGMLALPLVGVGVAVLVLAQR